MFLATIFDRKSHSHKKRAVAHCAKAKAEAEAGSEPVAFDLEAAATLTTVHHRSFVQGR
jgi:hypothetical protein